MRRILLLTVTFVTGLALLATPAGAQPSLSEVVDAVREDGFYIETGADADPSEITQLVLDAPGLAVVVLGSDDPDGSNFAAKQVADELGGDATVLVVSPGEVGASSGPFREGALDTALDIAIERFDQGATTGGAARAFAESLGLVGVQPAAVQPAQTVSDSDSGSGGGGGGGGLLIFLLVIVVVIGGLFWFSKRKAQQVDAGEVDRARDEIRAQLQLVADDIVENEDSVGVSGNEQAVQYFREANEAYVSVSERVDSTTNLLDLAGLNDEIDRARWQLEASQALVEGRDIPPEPEPEKPSACFFDPTHKPGSQDATIRTSAGEKEVRVCQSCADKLAKGERPEPRMIDVRGKRVPAAKAPRSHGGLGMGGLSVFEVILGGLGALASTRGRSAQRAAPSRRSSSGVGVDWGDMLPKRRPRGATFRQDRQPSRPLGLPRTPASRRSSSSRGRSSSSRRRSSKRSLPRAMSRRRRG